MFYMAWWSTGYAGFPSWMNWALWAIYWVLILFFAIACHRLALLEEVRQFPTLLPPFSRREAMFAVRGLGASLLYAIVQWVLLAVAASANAHGSGAGSDGYWMRWIAWAAGMYVFARLALVFPATAIDAKTSFTESWLRTRGNGWRMLVVVGGVPAVLSYATDWLFSQALGIGAEIAVSVVIALFLAVEVTALSLSYRALTPQPPPGSSESPTPSRTPGP